MLLVKSYRIVRYARRPGIRSMTRPCTVGIGGIDNGLDGLIRGLVGFFQITPVAGDLPRVLSLKDGGRVSEIGRLPWVDE